MLKAKTIKYIERNSNKKRRIIYIKEIKNIFLTPCFKSCERKKKKQLKMYLGTLCYVGSTQRTKIYDNFSPCCLFKHPLNTLAILSHYTTYFTLQCANG